MELNRSGCCTWNVCGAWEAMCVGHMGVNVWENDRKSKARKDINDYQEKPSQALCFFLSFCLCVRVFVWLCLPMQYIHLKMFLWRVTKNQTRSQMVTENSEQTCKMSTLNQSVPVRICSQHAMNFAMLLFINKHQTKQIFFLLNRNGFLFDFFCCIDRFFVLFDESVSIACATYHHWVWIISTFTVFVYLHGDVSVCGCGCGCGCAYMTMYGEQTLAEITASLGFAKKSQPQKYSKISRRKNPARKKRKKSTSECGQFYLHCLPLCLITCSSLSPSLHSFSAHCIRNLLHTHEKWRKKNKITSISISLFFSLKRVANRLHFYEKKRIFYAYVLRF